MAWTGGVMVAGALLYPLLQTARARGWCEFAGAQPCAPACLLPSRPFAAVWAMCTGQPESAFGLGCAQAAQACVSAVWRSCLRPALFLAHTALAFYVLGSATAGGVICSSPCDAVKCPASGRQSSWLKGAGSTMPFAPGTGTERGLRGARRAGAAPPRRARRALRPARVRAEQACRRTSSSMRSSPGCPSCTSPWPQSRSPSWRPWRARPATPPATSRACRPSRSRASAWTTTRWRPAPLVALTLTLCAGACGDARALAFRARQLKRQPGGAPCLSSACHVAG